MRHSVRFVVAAAVAAAAAVSVTGCGGGTGTSVAGPSASVTQEAAPVLVDVRTPAEFAEGHLDGAVNIPVESPDFVAQVEAAAPGGTVEVYCRSGNRSGQAAAMLSGTGLDVVDLGSYDSAASITGLPTV